MLRMDARVQKEGGTIMKAAIYCRLSKEDEDKIGESESIQNQKSMLLQYAIEKGFDIYQIYSDEDYSGIDRNRPAFNSMLQAASEHQFDVVLAQNAIPFLPVTWNSWKNICTESSWSGESASLRW